MTKLYSLVTNYHHSNKKGVNKTMQIQVTIVTESGQYKPISCLVTVESLEYFMGHKKEVQQKGVKKICASRYWDARDLKRYGYTKVKMRQYIKPE